MLTMVHMLLATVRRHIVTVHPVFPSFHSVLLDLSLNMIKFFVCFFFLVLFLDRMAVIQSIVCWDDTTSSLSHAPQIHVMEVGGGGGEIWKSPSQIPNAVHRRSHPLTSKELSMLSHTYTTKVTRSPVTIVFSSIEIYMQ